MARLHHVVVIGLGGMDSATAHHVARIALTRLDQRAADRQANVRPGVKQT
ncbi:hypothetical protein ACFYZ2_03345 [Streptomyces sviceus]